MDTADRSSRARVVGQVSGPRTEDRPGPPRLAGEHGGRHCRMRRPLSLRRTGCRLPPPPDESLAEAGRFDFLDKPRAAASSGGWPTIASAGCWARAAWAWSSRPKTPTCSGRWP